MTSMPLSSKPSPGSSDTMSSMFFAMTKVSLGVAACAGASAEATASAAPASRLRPSLFMRPPLRGAPGCPRRVIASDESRAADSTAPEWHRSTAAAREHHSRGLDARNKQAAFGRNLPGVLARGEILAPAFAVDRALHDLAAAGRLELQADLAPLLSLRHELIVRIGVRDLLALAHGLLRAGGNRQPAGNCGGDRERGFQQGTSGDHVAQLEGAGRGPASPRVLLLRDQLFLARGDVPEHDVIVRIRHAGMAGVEIEAHVIDLAAGRREIAERLLAVQVLERDHVDRADQLAVVVIGEERY